MEQDNKTGQFGRLLDRSVVLFSLVCAASVQRKKGRKFPSDFSEGEEKRFSQHILSRLPPQSNEELFPFAQVFFQHRPRMLFWYIFHAYRTRKSQGEWKTVRADKNPRIRWGYCAHNRCLHVVVRCAVGVCREKKRGKINTQRGKEHIRGGKKECVDIDDRVYRAAAKRKRKKTQPRISLSCSPHDNLICLACFIRRYFFSVSNLLTFFVSPVAFLACSTHLDDRSQWKLMLLQ